MQLGLNQDNIETGVKTWIMILHFKITEWIFWSYALNIEQVILEPR